MAQKGTKWKLFVAAVDLFATRGYEGVGVRDIAAAVGIRSASLYNHFEDKEAILARIYQYFQENYLGARQDIYEVLDLVLDLPVPEVLERALPQFTDDEVFNLVRKMILVLTMEAEHDAQAKKLLRDVMEGTARRLEMVLLRMKESGMVREMNARAMAGILTRFELSMAMDLEGDLGFKDWQKRRVALLGLIES